MFTIGAWFALKAGMAYIISSACIGTCDSSCVDVCPCDCIHGPVPTTELRAVPAREREARFPGLQLFIDPEVCIDCGACVPECPAEAIYEENALPDRYRDDRERNARFFKPE